MSINVRIQTSSQATMFENFVTMNRQAHRVINHHFRDDELENRK